MALNVYYNKKHLELEHTSRIVEVRESPDNDMSNENENDENEDDIETLNLEDTNHENHTGVRVAELHSDTDISRQAKKII